MANTFKPPCDAGVIRSSPANAPCPRSAGPWVLAATILGSSMAFIDSSVVNVALPAIQADLEATAVEALWVVESYALFLAALILMGGSLGDRFGRRRIFASGIALFAVASVWSGLAPDAGQLIAARAVQGVGGALLVPGSLAIISASFERERRGRAIGTWAGFTAITSALGPVMGGWLTENLSWRWVFFINVPLAAIVLGIAFRYVPESRNPGAARLDLPGALLATAGLGGIVYGLIESSRLGLSDPLVPGALVIGTAALVAFLVVERRSREPMMPLTLFRSRNFSGANLLTLLLYSAMGGSLYFFPFILIQVQGYSATAAGAAFLPFILIMFVLSRWAGGLVSCYGAKLPLVVGPVIAAVGFVLFAVPGIGGGYWTTYFPAVVVLGLGMSVSVAPLTTTVMSAVEDRHSGLASGINNAVSRVASLLAVAVLGIFVFAAFSNVLDDRVEDLDLSPQARAALEAEKVDLGAAEVPEGVSGEMAAEIERAIDEAFLAGFRLIMLVAAGLALASAAVAFFMIEGKGQARRAHRPGQAGDEPAPA